MLVGLVELREPWLMVDLIRWFELYPCGQFVLGPRLLPLSRLTRSTQVCKPWRRELEARGFCSTTVQLCSALAKGVDAERLGQSQRLRQSPLRRRASTQRTTLWGTSAQERDGAAFLEKSRKWKGGLHEWLQAASQAPPPPIPLATPLKSVARPVKQIATP